MRGAQHFSSRVPDRLHAIALRLKFAIRKQAGTTAHYRRITFGATERAGGRPLLSDYHEDSETYCRVGCADVRSRLLGAALAADLDPAVRTRDLRQPCAYSEQIRSLIARMVENQHRNDRAIVEYERIEHVVLHKDGENSGVVSDRTERLLPPAREPCGFGQRKAALQFLRRSIAPVGVCGHCTRSFPPSQRPYEARSGQV